MTVDDADYFVNTMVEIFTVWIQGERIQILLEESLILI